MLYSLENFPILLFLLNPPLILTITRIDQFASTNWQPGFPPHHLTETASLKSTDEFLKAKHGTCVHPSTVLAPPFFHEMFTFS